MTTRSDPIRAAVFASGGGSNFQALVDSVAPTSSWTPALLVCDRADAGAVDRAGAAGIPSVVVPVRDRTPEAVAAETLDRLQEHEIGAVFLAGYLKLIPATVVEAYRGRILNVHPALLPAFGGKGMYGRRVHEAVLAAGARLSGPTIHLVDEEYDRGRILAQWPVPVLPDDDPASLAARVLEAEHRLYPATAEHVCAALRRGEPAAPYRPAGDRFQLVADRPEE